MSPAGCAACARRRGNARRPPRPTSRRCGKQRESARRGADETPSAYLTGQLEAIVDVTGAGQSTAEILSTLEGPVQVTLRDGTMSHLLTEALGLDVAQALGVAIKGDAALPLRCARFDFTTHNGVMRLERGVFDNADSTIRVVGQVDWRNEQLALAARARPKDISPVSLRAPVIVTGTLSDPVVRIEPSRLGARALGALALGALVGPLAAVIPLVDLGEREQGDPCSANASRRRQPAAGGVQGRIDDPLSPPRHARSPVRPVAAASSRWVQRLLLRSTVMFTSIEGFAMQNAAAHHAAAHAAPTVSGAC